MIHEDNFWKGMVWQTVFVIVALTEKKKNGWIYINIQVELLLLLI